MADLHSKVAAIVMQGAVDDLHPKVASPARTSRMVRAGAHRNPPPPRSIECRTLRQVNGGVVVVGFVGHAGSAARLTDRILDAPVFSPGGSARTLTGGVRYHRDGERKTVFLHLAPPPPPLEAGDGSGGDLRELLFMFSVPDCELSATRASSTTTNGLDDRMTVRQDPTAPGAP